MTPTSFANERGERESEKKGKSRGEDFGEPQMTLTPIYVLKGFGPPAKKIKGEERGKSHTRGFVPEQKRIVSLDLLRTTTGLERPREKLNVRRKKANYGDVRKIWTGVTGKNALRKRTKQTEK